MSAVRHDVFQAIADPTRRELLRLLSREEMPIAKIASHFSVSRTAIVKHLQILSDAKLVIGRKEGRERLYSLQPEPLEEVKQWLTYYEQFWNNKLTMLKYIAENDQENS
ncbi:ArsR/SmtB family transcription factor [Bacillus dakarensis]|uniref:ArsR/SmtB family transcription factor n=1 Tax=Robertmurraya dakarensis TaxID=1926278 RepID=UPI0009819869|nr:metalloregulator ArsR/SmtB family transcription factor [Bacillus dakarensis]